LFALRALVDPPCPVVLTPDLANRAKRRIPLSEIVGRA
jgi:hypothetical protein